MDIQCPLIIIGAGRSGSTLLTRLFQAHPGMDFRGETSFLVARLWLESWGDRFWFQWAHDSDSHPRRSACDPMPPVPPLLLEQTRARVARSLAEFFVSLLQIDPRRACWGYKEIWNGSGGFRYDWSAYDAVFPGAWWLHQVRHPFEFARSCASWNDVPLTLDHLKDRLVDWCAMVQFNRARAATGRFFEVRHEDVVVNPDGTVAPILKQWGLEWQDACTAALGQRHMESRPARPPSESTAAFDGAAVANLVASIPDLASLMADLRYAVPASLHLDRAPRSGSRPAVNLRNPLGEEATFPPPRHVLEEELRQPQRDTRRIDELIQTCQELQAQIGIRSWLRRKLRWLPGAASLLASAGGLR